ncbi:hypothetical protein HYY71_05540 [Candidatus Woesearchaeota archaeon]|nr:hypothetical protein [Candidatus Woesearchaeota archaeon]
MHKKHFQSDRLFCIFAVIAASLFFISCTNIGQKDSDKALPSGRISSIFPKTCTIPQDKNSCDISVKWSAKNAPGAGIRLYSDKTGKEFRICSPEEKVCAIKAAAGAYTMTLYSDANNPNSEIFDRQRIEVKKIEKTFIPSNAGNGKSASGSTSQPGSSVPKYSRDSQSRSEQDSGSSQSSVAPDQTGSQSQQFNPNFALTSMYPSKASVGDTITITGNGFTPTGNTLIVQFPSGQTASMPVTLSEDGSSVQFAVPASLNGIRLTTGTYLFRVSNANGVSTVQRFEFVSASSIGQPSSDAQYNYNPALTLQLTQPSNIPQFIGNTLTFTGSGFLAPGNTLKLRRFLPEIVTFTVPNFVFSSDTSFEFTIPSAINGVSLIPGDYLIWVSGHNGDSSPQNFIIDVPFSTALPTPTITPTAYADCVQIDSINNNLNDNRRINIVLVNFNMNLEDFKKFTGFVMDFEGIYNGLFSKEPYKYNREKFNVLIVNRQFPLLNTANLQGGGTVGPGLVYFNYINSNNIGSYCPLPNKKILALINNDPNFILGIAYPNDKSVTSIVYPFPSQIIAKVILGRVLHEGGGHTIGGLLDEYNFRQSTLIEPGTHPIEWGMDVEKQCYFISTSERPCQRQGAGYYCGVASEALLERCYREAPWHDLVGNGCGQDGVIDCQQNNPDYYNEIRCFDQGCTPNGFKATSSIMSHYFPDPNHYVHSYGAHDERLICQKIRQITGSAGGICSNLCIDGCATGQRCVQGACKDSSQPAQTPSGPTTQNPVITNPFENIPTDTSKDIDSSIPSATTPTNPIVSPSLNIIFPNGGETIQKGAIQTIRWSSNGIPSSNLVAIILRHIQVNAYADYTLKTNAANDGTEDIVIPLYIQDGNYKISIKTTVSGNLISDLSDNTFAIGQNSVKEPVNDNTQNQESSNHLRHFGYGFVDCGINNNGVTNYITEVSPFTNIADICASQPWDNIESRINLMSQNDVKPIIFVQSIFFDSAQTGAQLNTNVPFGGSGKRSFLRSDYLNRWNTFVSNNNLNAYASKIQAFYLFDEPTWNGLQFDSLKTAADAIKAYFPTTPILIIEGWPSVRELRVPASVDWIGFDRYAVRNPMTDAAYQNEYAILKSKRSTPNQKIMIVMDGSWYASAHGAAGISQSDMAQVAANYYNLAQSDPDVIAIGTFLWPNGLDPADRVGSRSLPQNVKDEHRRIGQLITGKSAVNQNQQNAPVAQTAPAQYPDCYQIDSANNNLNDAGRINLVLVGVNYATLVDFKNAFQEALDVNGNNEGFFSVEPFKSNRNKFNLLYVNDVLALSSSSASFNYDSSAVQSVRQQASKCNFQNKYTFIIVNTAGNLIVPGIGETSGVGSAIPFEHAAITRFPYPISNAAELRNNKGTFIHENGGHEIGGLFDEHTHPCLISAIS